MTFSISSSASIARMIGASLMASGRVPNMVMTRSDTDELLGIGILWTPLCRGYEKPPMRWRAQSRRPTTAQPCSAAARTMRPARREGLLLGVTGEDLHERIGLELRELASAPAPPWRGLQRLRITELEGCEPSLLRPLVHGVLEQGRRLLLVALGEVVREPAVLPRHLDGIAVHHDPAALHPDRA